MKYAKMFATMALGLMVAVLSAGLARSQDLTNYSLVFADDFANDTPTAGTSFPSNVTTGNWTGPSGPVWFTQTDQCCMAAIDDQNQGTGVLYPGFVYGFNTPNPFTLGPGGLNIKASMNSGPTTLPGYANITHAWTSGLIASVDRTGQGRSWQYGYFEMKAKVPSGIGTWPAFWMLNVNSLTGNTSTETGEIDIMEAYGQYPTKFNNGLHNWSSNPKLHYGSTNTVPVDISADYHTYGMLWTAESMKFYFDGALQFTTPTLPVFQQPYFLMADLGVGGGGQTANPPDPSIMSIQYIHVYQVNTSPPPPRSGKD